MAERSTREERWAYCSFALTNLEAAEKGKRALLDTTTGKATITPSSVTLDLGLFDETRTGDGTTHVRIKLHDEITLRRWDNDSGGGNAITATDLGKIVFVKDATTVSLSSTGGRAVAGRAFAVTSQGVLVAAPFLGAGPAPAPRAATISFVANDAVVPDHPAPGAIYDVPTTAGASTVTLPATALEGTIVQFHADGAKNGHTVQYRDATGPVNLTTALIASKRHLVIATFLGGKWAANAYVAP